MHDKTLIRMVLLMVLVAFVVVLAATALLYKTGVERERANLLEMAQSQAELMNAVARFDVQHSNSSYPGGGAAATLSQIEEAHRNYERIGESGELLVGQRRGDEIEFLLSHSSFGVERIPAVSWNSNIAEPMRRALNGEHGVMVGIDYRGERVLAAYTSVPALNVGLVVKIDMAEVMRPYLNAATVAFMLALGVTVIGVLLLRRISKPVFEAIEKQNDKLTKMQVSLSTAQQISHMGSWDWNIVTNELWWSDEIYRIFGLTPQQFAATYDAFLEYIHPDDRSKVQEGVQQALESAGFNYKVEHRVVRPDGTERIVVEQGEVRRNSEGVPVHMVGTVHDITERKQVEERLLLSDQVFKESGEAIMITRASGEIVDVNDAFVRITGYGREEVLGRKPSFMKSDRHDREFYTRMWQQLIDEGGWSGEVWDRRKDGMIFPKALTITAVKDTRGSVSHYIGIFSDISHNKLVEQQLQKMAFYDELTGLPNRVLCKDRVNHELKVAHRRGEKVAILFLDLDRFKYVNDTLGHSIGDLLLLEAARRIQGCVRESDTVARLGGDEFVVVLTSISSSKLVERIANCIITSISAKFRLNGQEVGIGVSIGISFYPDNGLIYEELAKNADAAMYRAKEAGRNTFRFFTHEQHQAMMERVTMERALRSAIDHEALDVYYQPKIDLRTGKICGMEALLRWPHENGTMVMPATFIPLAEEAGLIVPLGEWVLRQACRQTVAWHRAGYKTLRVAVNLSGKQFEQHDLAARIEAVLREEGLAAEYLELEVTESMVMRDAERAIVDLRRLCKLGVSVSIDDFGTGYSSLAYLKALPIQSLKIDRSFVRDLTIDSDDAAIVSAIISMANTLDLKVVAEGVETAEQLEFLRRDGCGEAQGYLFSRPVPAAQFEQLLAGPDFAAQPKYLGDIVSIRP